MQIDKSKLHKDQTVWYCYERRPDIMGPFLVKSFARDHRGLAVILRTPMGRVDERRVALASDDDYGEPLFYNSAERE